jgi:hypothetical protein
MFLIRKPGAMLILIGMGMLAGCQWEREPRPPTNGNLSDAAIPTDQAMDKRQWDSTQAHYANDGVFAHPNYSPFRPTPLDNRFRLNALTEPWLYLADVAYIPVGVFIDYPWSFRVNKSISAPPSYTLMPALPEGQEPVPTY